MNVISGSSENYGFHIIFARYSADVRKEPFFQLGSNNFLSFLRAKDVMDITAKIRMSHFGIYTTLAFLFSRPYGTYLFFNLLPTNELVGYYRDVPSEQSPDKVINEDSSL